MKEFINDFSLTIDWSKFRESNYWLSPSPYDDSGFWQEIIIFLILLAIYTWIMTRRWKTLTQHPSYQKLRKGLVKSTIMFEVFMLLWVFFRTQSIYLLSNHLIGASIIMLWLIWVGWIAYYRFKIMPKLLLNEIDKMRKEKYLPKSKKK